MIAPLQGYKVIELATMITGPLAGMMLGDLGAEVIKVERPGGDPFRHFEGSSFSPHFVAFNRNKRSVVLDLTETKDRDKLLALLVDADAFIENLRSGTLRRLGFTDASLRRRFPRLIHCSITGFGNNGPYRNRPAYDTIGQALSGIASLAVLPHEPRFTGTTISDNATGMYAAYAILAALLERGRTGRGRKIDINMLEVSVAFIQDAFMNLQMLGLRNDAFTRVSFSQVFVCRCRDGQLLALHLSSPAKFWLNLLKAIDRSELGKDERFATRERRIANYAALSDDLQKSFVLRTRQEWIERLTAVDVPVAPILKSDEVMADAQVRSLGCFRPMELPTGATVQAVQAPLLIDGQRLSTWRGPPLLGEKNAGQLSEAGFAARSPSDGGLSGLGHND